MPKRRRLLLSLLVGLLATVGFGVLMAVPMLANQLVPPPPGAAPDATGILVVLAEFVGVMAAFIFWMAQDA